MDIEILNPVLGQMITQNLNANQRITYEWFGHNPHTAACNDCLIHRYCNTHAIIAEMSVNAENFADRCSLEHRPEWRNNGFTTDYFTDSEDELPQADYVWDDMDEEYDYSQYDSANGGSDTASSVSSWDDDGACMICTPENFDRSLDLLRGMFENIAAYNGMTLPEMLRVIVNPDSVFYLATSSTVLYAYAKLFDWARFNLTITSSYALYDNCFLSLSHRFRMGEDMGDGRTFSQPEYDRIAAIVDTYMRYIDCKCVLLTDANIKASKWFTANCQILNGYLNSQEMRSSGLVRDEYAPYVRMLRGEQTFMDMWRLRSNGMSILRDEAIDVALSAALYAHSPDFTTIFLLFIKHLHRYIKTVDLIEPMMNFARKIYNTMTSKVNAAFDGMRTASVPTQHTEGLTMRSSSDTTDSMSMVTDFIAEHGDTVPAVVSLFGGLTFAIVSATVGVKAYKTDSPSASFLDRFSKLGLKYSGISRGVDGLMNLIKKFNDLIKFCLSYFLGLKTQNRVMAAVLQTDVENTETFDKKDFAQHVEYMLDPKNLAEIQGCSIKRHNLEKCDQVASTILKDVADGKMSLSRECMTWFTHIKMEIKKLRAAIHRCPKTRSMRVPSFVIMFSGPPGGGKTVASMKLARDISAVCFKSDPSYDFKASFEDDNYPKNFVDKYMPGYNGQSIVIIDDIFQDASSSGNETSSALSLIAYASSTPHFPVQASLEEKGMPFTSKIIIASTNNELPVRPEIVCGEALLSRIRVMIRCTWKMGVCETCIATRGINLCEECAKLNDPTYGRPVKFELLELKSKDIMRWEVKKVMNWDEVRKYAIKSYMSYWRTQSALIESCENPDPEDVNRLLKEINEEMRSSSLMTVASIIKDRFKQNMYEWFIERPQDGWNNLRSALVTSGMVHELENNVKILSYVSDLYARGEEHWYMVDVDDEYYMCPRAYQLKVDYSNDLVTSQWVQRLNAMLIQDCKDNGSHTSELTPAPFIARLLDEYKAKRNREMETARKEFDGMWNSWANSAIGYAVGAAMAAFVTYFGYKAVNKLMTRDMDSSNVKYTTQAKRVRTERITVMPQMRSSHDDDFAAKTKDEQAFRLIDTLEAHDTVCYVRIHTDFGTANAICVRVGGPYLLMNAHQVERLPANAVMEIIIPNAFGERIVMQDFDPERIVHFKTAHKIDAVLYKCDATMPAARDITKHFLEDEVETASTPACLYSLGRLDVVKSCVELHVNLRATPLAQHWKKNTYRADNGEDYSVLGFYQYHANVRLGGSGSLLIATNPKYKNKLLGIQVSINGDDTIGYAQPITCRMLQQAMGKYIEPVVEEDMRSSCKMVDGSPPEELATSGLKFIGKLDKSEQLVMAKKTKYCKSLIFDPDNVTQEPSVLSTRDKRMDPEFIGKSVLFRNLKGFDKPGGLVRTRILDKATEWLSNHYATRHRGGMARRLLTNFEMVNGVSPFLKQFDMRTAPGYPYVKQRKEPLMRGKFEWFDETIDPADGKKTYMPKKELQDQIDYRYEMAKQGRRIPTIAYACLKDETRPIEKIKKGKTRVFLCEPMDYNLLVRKLFGAFIMMMHKKAAVEISACVGIDPVKAWTALATRLRSIGANFEDFDYGGWDTQIPACFTEAFVKIVNAWYDDGPENALARETLIQELAHTFFIAQDCMFLKKTGQVSGFALTAECNSAVNELLMVYCWIILAALHDKDMCNFESFLENCALGVYGDDIVKSVSNQALWFNGNNIKEIIDEIGMEITTGNKSGTQFEFTELENLTFLKRSFRPLAYGRYTAPLREDIIENITQWIHACDNPALATNVNVETAARNYALWGEQSYNSFRKRVNDRLASAIEKGDTDLRPLTSTFGEIMEAIESGALLSVDLDFD